MTVAVLSGFGNHHSSETAPGLLPIGRNSPQRVPQGLYAEQLSATAFTVPRDVNRRSWLYRRRPSAMHPPFTPHSGAANWLSAPLSTPADPNRQRWSPMPSPQSPTDFIEGMFTLAASGGIAEGQGFAAHIYAANRSMTGRAAVNADGEMLLVPQLGRLLLVTELGRLPLEPGMIGLIPCGMRFRIELLDDVARGYVCENYGEAFRLPELGPIGANGLASARDFEVPVAACDVSDGPTELIQKYQGRFWRAQLAHSPFDVLAWHGNLVPCRYELARFNTLGSVSFDHPDPSIFTVLTAPGQTAGTANVDFVIFPPRWMVAEDTFRPPWFHRNIMSEFMGLIRGSYDAKAGGFVPGGASLHPAMSAHGPDRASYKAAVAADLKPVWIADGLAFMFEGRAVLRPTAAALEAPWRQADYDDCWSGFPADGSDD